MTAMLISEAPDHFLMRDRQGEYKVPKADLRADLHAKIRGMAPQGKFLGGPLSPAASLPAEPFPVDPNAVPAVPGSVPQSWGMQPTPSGAGGSSGSVGVGGSGGAGEAYLDQLRDNSRGYDGASGGVSDPPPFGVVPPGGADQERAAELKKRKSQSDLADKYRNQTQASVEPQAAQPQPVAMARSGGMGSRDTTAGDIERASNEQVAAVRAKGAIDAEVAKQQANIQESGLRQMEAHALQKKELDERVRADAMGAMNRVKAAQDELSKIDTSVDPNRYWASLSTPGKIAGIIGLALGAMGAGNDGVNRSVQLLNQAIDRDLEAQKAEHTLRLQKGKQALEGEERLYGLTRQILGDDVAAFNASKADGLERTAQQMQLVASRAKEPQAKVQADATAAELKTQAAQLRSKAESQVAERGLTRAQTAHAWAQASMAGQHAVPAAQAQKVKDQIGAADDTVSALKDLYTNISDNGTWDLFSSAKDKRGQALNRYATFVTKFGDPQSIVSLNEIKSKLDALGVDKNTFFQRNSTALELIQNEISNIMARKQRIMQQGS